MVARVQVAQSPADHDAELDFIVEADALGTEDWASAGDEDGGWGLQEEKRLLGGFVVQFADVIAVCSWTCWLALLQ